MKGIVSWLALSSFIDVFTNGNEKPREGPHAIVESIYLPLLLDPWKC